MFFVPQVDAASKPKLRTYRRPKKFGKKSTVGSSTTTRDDKLETGNPLDVYEFTET
jgi:hypothetical protein